MRLRQHLQHAIKNLFSTKLRSFLAVLGILVGTASVVTLVSSGEMATAKAMEQFKRLGTDLMSVTLYMRSHKDELSSKPESISLEQVSQIKERIKSVREVAAYTTNYVPTAFMGHNIHATTIGATQSLQRVIKVSLAKGNFISYVNQYERFCVIGASVAKQIKPYYNGNLIGQQIWLGSQIYTIIGIAKPWPESSFFNADVNYSVIVPIQSSHLLNTNSTIRNLILRLSTTANIEEVKVSLQQLLQPELPKTQLYFKSAKEFIKSQESQHRTLTLLLGLIGGVSLIVGGIGIMNVMLVSVTERRREIGIRKAIGAKAKDIRMLFLLEAIVLSLIGGGMGVLLGIILSYIIAYFASWTFAFYASPPIVGFIVSAATGVFFGFYPASRAAKLNPINALQSE